MCWAVFLLGKEGQHEGVILVERNGDPYYLAMSTALKGFIFIQNIPYAGNRIGVVQYRDWPDKKDRIRRHI